MNKRPIFKLDPRLLVCANMVPEGAKIADIGTDHGYLPIWLAKKNKIKYAVASDLRVLPLGKAKINIKKYHVEDIVEVRLSNGLEEINQEEVDTVIIAGMGGELIASIVDNAKWLKSKNINLILQPMSAAEKLRRFLFKENYKIYEEMAVYSENKVYSVIKAKFVDERIKVDEVYPYIGLLNKNIGEEAKTYIEKEIVNLKNRIKGLQINKNYDEADKLKNIVKKIEEK